MVRCVSIWSRSLRIRKLRDLIINFETQEAREIETGQRVSVDSESKGD